MDIYTHLEDEFMLLDYLPSHSQLLFRSKRNKNRNYNIDILFKGVDLLSIPTRLIGISISSEQNMQPDKNIHEIFSIKDSEGHTFFLKASSFYVFHNKLELLVSGKANNDWIDLGELIYSHYENTHQVTWEDVNRENTNTIVEAKIKLYDNALSFINNKTFLFYFDNKPLGGSISLFNDLLPGDTGIVEIEFFRENMQPDMSFTFGNYDTPIGEGKILKVLTANEINASRKELFVTAKFVWKSKNCSPAKKEFNFLLAGKKVIGKIIAFYELDPNIYIIEILFSNTQFYRSKLFLRENISIADDIANGIITQIIIPPTKVFYKD